MDFRICVKNDRLLTIPSKCARNRFSGSSINSKKSKSATANGIGKRKWKAARVSSSGERFYRVPVQKVRDKCEAFFALRASRAFCAFYSISFPSGISDDIAFKLWNVWLTRVRKYKADFQYLWVTERQGNGTIHYHLITNSFLNIRVVNHYMAAAIDTAVNAGQCDWGDSSKELYNGVDVQRVHNPKGVSKYLTKYLTKKKKDKEGNIIEVDTNFRHLAWHCSRKVSALFTSKLLHGAQLAAFIGCPWFEAAGWQSNYNPQNLFHCNLFYYTQSPPNWVMREIRVVNERIWKDFYTEDFINNLIQYNNGNEFESGCESVRQWTFGVKPSVTSTQSKPNGVEPNGVSGCQQVLDFTRSAMYVAWE